MNGHVTCGRSSCLRSVGRLVVFGLSIAASSWLISGIVRQWIQLPWWTVFRRCVSVAAALILWVFMRRIHGQSVRSLGLGTFRQGKRQLIQGALLGFGAVLLVGAVYLTTQICRVAIHPDAWRVARTLIGFAPAAGLVAVLEELIFRGYVLQQLLACSKWLALTGSSAAYALVHLRPNPVWPSSAFELTGLFILGWVLAHSVLHTRQLYLAIGLHASLAYCARVNKLLVEFTTPSLQWLCGTNRLVNGVVAWFVLIVVGRIVTRLAGAPRRAEG
jgi:membrane protease YdiL (CAAX protease family)